MDCSAASMPADRDMDSLPPPLSGGAGGLFGMLSDARAEVNKQTKAMAVSSSSSSRATEYQVPTKASMATETAALAQDRLDGAGLGRRKELGFTDMEELD